MLNKETTEKKTREKTEMIRLVPIKILAILLILSLRRSQVSLKAKKKNPPAEDVSFPIGFEFDFPE